MSVREMGELMVVSQGYGRAPWWSVRDMGELHGGQSGIWTSFMVVSQGYGRASWWSVRDMGELHGGQSGIWASSMVVSQGYGLEQYKDNQAGKGLGLLKKMLA